MEKEMTLKEITGGIKFENVSCIIKDFGKSRDQFDIILADSETTRSAYVRSNLFSYEQIKSFQGKVVLVSGLHEPGINGVVPEKIKIKNIEIKPADADEFTEHMPHIEEQRVNEYIAMINAFKSYVGRETLAYRQLLEVYFSEENINIMKTMPATHIRQGSPLGGMLHATAAVTDMAYYLAMRYINAANGLYSFREKRCINWDLLITGALLHLAGNLLYFEKEPPHEKRAEGVEQGFSSCRQQVLLKLIYTNNIDIREEDLAALFGVMSKLNEQHEGIKKCRQESSFLYSAYCAFLEMDSFDAATAKMLTANAESSENREIMDSYDYSDALSCYVSKAEIERKAAVLGISLEKKEENGKEDIADVV